MPGLLFLKAELEMFFKAELEGLGIQLSGRTLAHQIRGPGFNPQNCTKKQSWLITQNKSKQ